MATQTFNCPACGAPLDYKGGPETTVRCPFCSNNVVVPPEVRRAAVLRQASGRPSIGTALTVILSAAAAMVVLGALVAVLGTRPQSSGGSPPSVIEAGQPTATPTPLPSPSPTPAFAMPGLSFGEQGIGPGQLNDARYLAVDGSGTLYVADYDDGRVQAFDAGGKYLSQFTVLDGQAIIHGLTADHQGHVFVAAGHTADILEYDGHSGQLLGKLTHPQGGEFGMLAATANGGLAATWYEGRWGMITSLEGHRDGLLLFDAQRKIALNLAGFISAQTGDLALDNYIAVDGLGKIFALSDGEVYVFSPQGKFTDKFDATGRPDGPPSHPNAIVVDGQERVYVGDSRLVHVYSADGRLIADFPLQDSVDAMALDEQDQLWVLGGEQVTEYTLTGK